MKLPIKKKYFDLIKSGKKDVEYRDAHITFVCEETGETYTRQIVGTKLMMKSELPKELRDNNFIFTDEIIVAFELGHSCDPNNLKQTPGATNE